jgi:tellurite resistance protein TerC
MLSNHLGWIIFALFVLVLVAIEIRFFNNSNSIKKNLNATLLYILSAFVFGGWVFYDMGYERFCEYITGFIVEKSLAFDNIFVISLVFSQLAIPEKYQRRVLFWGLIGVVVLRALMITVGIQLVNEFKWIMHLFAVFLIFTGIKIFFTSEKNPEFKDNFFINWLKHNLRITNEIHGHKFIIKQTNPKTRKQNIYFTPLFVALVFIEFIDIVFAFDSIPAILLITTDPFIIYTSNIFAIMGLRSLYFALAFIVNRFQYLKFALALVLIFIGSKVFITDWLNIAKFPATISISVTLGLLVGGCLYSVYKTKNSESI